MSDYITFLTELRTAGNVYLEAPRTRLKSILKWSSDESQSLAHELSSLKSFNEKELVAVVRSLVKYIKTKNSYDKSRRFWDDYIFPIIKKFANAPIKSKLSEKTITELQNIEFVFVRKLGTLYPVAEERTEFTQDSIRLLFDGLGYGKTPVERHPHLKEDFKSERKYESIAYQAKDRNSPLHYFGVRVMGYFNMQETKPELSYNDPLFSNCMIHANLREIFATLHLMEKQKKSSGCEYTHLGFFVEALAKTKLNCPLDEMKIFDEQKIICLKKLKRMGLGKISLKVLAALVSSNPRELDSEAKMRPQYFSILLDRNEVWREALNNASDNPISLENLLTKNDSSYVRTFLRDNARKRANLY